MTIAECSEAIAMVATAPDLICLVLGFGFGWVIRSTVGRFLAAYYAVKRAAR